MEERVSGNALVYTRRRLNRFFHAIAERTFDGSHTYFSDWPGLESNDVMDRFSRHYACPTPAPLTNNELHEIICRCRLLRVLPNAQSIRMVNAMWAAIVELIEIAKPTYVLSVSIDNYLTDILYRICVRRRIEPVMFGMGVMDNTILVAAQCEYTKVRDPSEEEIALAVATLMDDGTRVTYGQRFDGYSFTQHCVRVSRWWGRCLLFSSIRGLGLGRMRFRFLVESAKNGRGHKSLWDYPARRIFHADWEQRIADSQLPPIFIPMAYWPESSTDYWLRDVRFVDYENTVYDLCASLAYTYTPVVKEHWSMLGQRSRSLYERLKSIPGIVMVPASVNSRRVMSLVNRVVVGAGTAGVEAAIRGNRVVTLTVPYFYVDGHYLAIDSADDIGTLPAKLEGFRAPSPSAQTRSRLVRRLLEPTIRGSIVPDHSLDMEENYRIASLDLREYLIRIKADQAAASSNPQTSGSRRCAGDWPGLMGVPT